MRIERLNGLSVAIVDEAQALARDWSGWSETDVVRVRGPVRRDALAARGFLVKPAHVTWVRPAADEVTGRGRADLRAASRAAARDGIRLVSRDRVDAALFDKFLRLYEARVAEMRHGVPVARGLRDAVLSGGDWTATLAYRGMDLVGVTLAQVHAQVATLWLRFSAVDAVRREASLTRVLYSRAAAGARGYGCHQVALGTDPNLYGHVGKAGLFGFKMGLGFRPVPTQRILPGVGADEADLITGMTDLCDPAIVVHYAGPTLGATLFTQSEVDVRPYRLSRMGFHRVVVL